MVHEYTKGSSLRLSPNFNLNEFHCKCAFPECKKTYLDLELIEFLEKKRQQIGKPIKINSAFRCTQHNLKIGGKKGSIHLTGKAADIVIPGENMKELVSIFEDADGLGIYDSFLHVDLRGYKARWRGDQFLKIGNLHLI